MMSSGLKHISASIPGAVAALEEPLNLERQCADLDTHNPNALWHWTCRIRAMRRFPGADEALRYFLHEVASRRSDRQAKTKAYTNRIDRPGAWLNTQTLKWLERRKLAAANQGKNQ